jgi:hypothetical protein
MTTSTTRKARIIGAALTAALTIGTLAACIPVPPIQPDPPAGPTQPGDPQPPSLEGQLDPTTFDEGTRSIVVRVEHTPDPGPIFRMSMQKLRAYVRRGDIGPIKVETFDVTGKAIDSWTAARPGDEGGEGVKDPEARYAIPYTKGLTYVKITDTETGVSTDTKVTEVIQSFCAADPTDVACDDVDLTADITMETFGPRNLAVGESVDVKLFARFGNLRMGTTQANGRVRWFGGISDIATFATADATNWNWPVEGTFDSGYLPITYTLTCTKPGFDRIFPEAVVYSDGLASTIEALPTNDHWNVWFDVNCT